MCGFLLNNHKQGNNVKNLLRYGQESAVNEAILQGKVKPKTGRLLKKIIQVSSEQASIAKAMQAKAQEFTKQSFNAVFGEAVADIVVNSKGNATQPVTKMLTVRSNINGTSVNTNYFYPRAVRNDTYMLEQVIKMFPYIQVVDNKKYEQVMDAVSKIDPQGSCIVVIEGPNQLYAHSVDQQDTLGSVLETIVNGKKSFVGRPCFPWIVAGSKTVIDDFNKNYFLNNEPK